MSTLLAIVLTTLALTFVASYMILQAAVSERPLRRLLLAFIIVTPLIMLVAIAKTLFSRPKPIRYSAELGRIEDEIESERAETFGEKVVHPSFSERWRISYLYAIEKSALAAAKIDRSLGSSLCGISHLR